MNPLSGQNASNVSLNRYRPTLNFFSHFYCYTAVNCTAPPSRPPSGTWEWNGDHGYGAEAHYTCGLYGKFQSSQGDKYEELTSVCGWNRSWVPAIDQFDP